MIIFCVLFRRHRKCEKYIFDYILDLSPILLLRGTGHSNAMTCSGFWGPSPHMAKPTNPFAGLHSVGSVGMAAGSKKNIIREMQSPGLRLRSTLDSPGFQGLDLKMQVLPGS